MMCMQTQVSCPSLKKIRPLISSADISEVGVRAPIALAHVRPTEPSVTPGAASPSNQPLDHDARAKRPRASLDSPPPTTALVDSDRRDRTSAKKLKIAAHAADLIDAPREGLKPLEQVSPTTTLACALRG